MEWLTWFKFLTEQRLMIRLHDGFEFPEASGNWYPADVQAPIAALDQAME